MGSWIFMALVDECEFRFKMSDYGDVELGLVVRQDDRVTIEDAGTLTLFSVGPRIRAEWLYTVPGSPWLAAVLSAILKWFQHRFTDERTEGTSADRWSFFQELVESLQLEWPHTTWAATVAALRSGQLKAAEEENSHVQV